MMSQLLTNYKNEAPSCAMSVIFVLAVRIRLRRIELRSPLTVTLADMIALVTDTDLVDVLVRLCKVLEQQPEESLSHA
jgi:hypothetical protein